MAWRAVNDDLPKGYETVLVHTPASNEPVWLGYYENDAGEWRYIEGSAARGITHWAPLPAAPEVVAEAFGKRHDDVLKRIRSLDCSEGFSARNFAAATYVDAQGKPREMFDMTRDGFVFLCMGFTGATAAAMKEAYIARFNEMEAALFGRRTFGLAPADGLSPAQYDAELARLTAELNALRSRPIVLSAEQYHDLTVARMRVGKKEWIVPDLMAALEALGVPREVAADSTGLNRNTLRQHAFRARRRERQPDAEVPAAAS